MTLSWKQYCYFSVEEIDQATYNVIKIKQNIELCAIYWHFLLIVWLVLFGLMVAT